jgi:hypothetical protein
MVVAIGKDRGRYIHTISHDPPGRVAPAVHLRFDVFDNDALAAFNWFHMDCNAFLR